MRFHIVQVGENKEKIASLYKISENDLNDLNPTLTNRDLIIGEKIRINDENYVEDISNIYLANSKEEVEEEKYICPHCKNIIIIPRK